MIVVSIAITASTAAMGIMVAVIFDDGGCHHGGEDGDADDSGDGGDDCNGCDGGEDVWHGGDDAW